MCESIYFLGANIKPLSTHNIRDGYYYITNDGKVFNKFMERIRTFISNSGYERVQVYLNRYKNNRRVAKKFSIHRLVAEYYVENDDPDNKNQVNHINGDKLYNHYTNLEWVSQSDNLRKAYDSNLCTTKGELCHFHNSKYTDEIVHSICKCLTEQMPYFDIIKNLELCDTTNRSSKEYQLWRKYLKNIKHRRCRRDITSQYVF